MRLLWHRSPGFSETLLLTVTGMLGSEDSGWVRLRLRWVLDGLSDGLRIPVYVDWRSL